MKRMRGKHSFLTRLRHDTAGNTIALVAAAIIPLAGMIGGAVDMSRLYLVKTRMQQACDAGALAGRKAMGGGGWTTGTNNGSTEDTANKLFNANFVTGAYGTGTLINTFEESNGTVTGTASVIVPMTLMRIFNMTERNVSVSCTAKMEIPNTDVMFVLDVTGSMATDNKIGGLKSAVKCFYESLLRVNTTEVCGNDPTATSSTTTAQIRMGFVPYSVNVNVGKLLPNAFLADDWAYDSRRYGWDGVTYDTNNSASNWTYVSGSAVTGNRYEGTCPSNTKSSSDVTSPTTTTTAPDGTITTSYTITRTTTGMEYESSTSGGWNNRKYYCTATTYTNYQERQVNSTVKSPHYAYTYERRTLNVSGLKAGGDTWNNSIPLDVGTAGATTNVVWKGCIEERHTYQNTDGTPGDEWSPVPAEALDMNIDLVPTATSTYNSFWGPLLNGATWARYNWGYSNCTKSGRTTSSVDTSCNASSSSVACPTEARKLTTYNTPGPFESYVNSLSTGGNTYHDIGMLWGARLMSPTGIFASENAFTPAGRAIQRHLIFMTDGDTNTTNTDYSAYGIGYYSRLQAQGNLSDTQMDNMTDARTAALCTAIKNMNITLWVISYGSGVGTATETRLENCASPGRYYKASDGAALIARFRQIASEISELRLIN
ncbi:MAG: hypothetical protein BGP16_02475 [Sphingobium sp. 66-54]|nr:MAG: hypothetical protein BGP16_02475 [Sphingobium sp. 66-54]